MYLFGYCSIECRLHPKDLQLPKIQRVLATIEIRDAPTCVKASRLVSSACCASSDTRDSLWEPGRMPSRWKVAESPHLVLGWGWSTTMAGTFW